MTSYLNSFLHSSGAVVVHFCSKNFRNAGRPACSSTRKIQPWFTGVAQAKSVSNIPVSSSMQVHQASAAVSISEISLPGCDTALSRVNTADGVLPETEADRRGDDFSITTAQRKGLKGSRDRTIQPWSSAIADFGLKTVLRAAKKRRAAKRIWPPILTAHLWGPGQTPSWWQASRAQCPLFFIRSSLRVIENGLTRMILLVPVSGLGPRLVSVI